MHASPPRLTDAHCHLQDPRLQPFLHKALDEAQAVGVYRFVANATSLDDWDALRSLARDHPGRILPAYGIHPWHATPPDPAWKRELEDALRDPLACVGEIGLDGWITPRNADHQQSLFRAQLDIAMAWRRPVTVHALRAEAAVYAVLESLAPLPIPVLIHAFGGSIPQLQAFIELGCHVSFSAATLAEGRRRARAACAVVPADRLLVETDAPDMCPPPGKGIRDDLDGEGVRLNHPANLPAGILCMTRIRGCRTEEMVCQLEANADRFLSHTLRAR